jgi:hypothetical protein
MSYLFCGYVLTSEPDLRKFQGLDADIGWRLYCHKRDRLWLLDMYRRSSRPHEPFSEFATVKSKAELAQILPRAEDLAGCLHRHGIVFFDQDELRWLFFLAHMSSLLDQEVHGFLSDDEAFHVTCTCRSGSVTRFHAELECLDATFGEGEFTFRPILSEEDPETTADSALLEQIGELEHVRVLEPITIPGGGRRLHQIVVDDWPPGAGHASDLGLNEAIPELDFDFELVKAVEPGTSVAKRQKSWFGGVLDRLIGGSPRQASRPVPRPLTGSQIAEVALESVSRCWGNVARFGKEGNKQYLVLNLHAICENLLIHTLHSYDKPLDAVAFLREQGCSNVLKRAITVALQERADRLSKGLPVGGVISGYTDTDIHLAWLLGEHVAANELMTTYLAPESALFEEDGHFQWKYITTMKCVADKRACVLDTTSGFGFAYPLVTACAVLMSDIASCRPWEESLNRVDDAWQGLNRNHRVESYRVDGSGNHPVRWNFRRASILSYAREFYGIDASL